MSSTWLKDITTGRLHPPPVWTPDPTTITIEGVEVENDDVENDNTTTEHTDEQQERRQQESRLER